MNKPVPYQYSAVIQSDHLRNMYDTYELIDNFKKQDFLSSDEIINRQGSNVTIIASNEKPKKTLKERFQ